MSAHHGDEVGHPTLPGHLEPIDPAPYLDALATRFGIDPHILSERFRFFRSGGRNLAAVAATLDVPEAIQIRFTGIRLLRTAMATPKPTSEAVPLLGVLATRHTVHLRADEVDAVRRHEDFLVETGRIRDYQAPGFVIAVFRDIPVALVSALPYTASPQGDDTPSSGRPSSDRASSDRVLLRSWYPKRRLGHLAE